MSGRRLPALYDLICTRTVCFSEFLQKTICYNISSMKNYFGGAYLKNKRKTQRPLDFKKSTHLVLRLKDHLPSLLSPRDLKLRTGFHKLAEKYEIRVYQLVFNHTHLHSVLLIPNRNAYVAFIRELTSKLVLYFARTVRLKVRRIFQNRPFTRIVSWGKGMKILRKYMQKNESESGVLQLERNSKSNCRSPDRAVSSGSNWQSPQAERSSESSCRSPHRARISGSSCRLPKEDASSNSVQLELSLI